MMDKTILEDLCVTKMPYGRYKGSILAEIPEHYLLWHKQKGFPAGRLGQMLETVYEMKLNGLDDMLRELQKRCDKARHKQ
jgi:uncharacterized protein